MRWRDQWRAKSKTNIPSIVYFNYGTNFGYEVTYISGKK